MIKAFAIQYTTFNQAKAAEIIAYSVNARHAAHSIRGKGKDNHNFIRASWRYSTFDQAKKGLVATCSKNIYFWHGGVDGQIGHLVEGFVRACCLEA